jgi:hypothetical protein
MVKYDPTYGIYSMILLKIEIILWDIVYSKYDQHMTLIVWYTLKDMNYWWAYVEDIWIYNGNIKCIN